MVKIKHKDPTTQALIDALQKVFGVGEKQKKFIDVGRIPLLCKSVIEMRGDIREIKENQAKLTEEIKTTVQKSTVQEIRERKEEAQSEKWKDRLYTIVLNAVVFILILILMRTGIINIK